MAQRKEISADAEVIPTGGEIDGMVMALIEHANDGNAEARKTFHSSLKDIGKKQPLLVLSSCESYLVKHKKLDMHHRIILLNIMRDTLVERMDEVSSMMAARLVRLGGQEMTAREELMPEWQSAASAVIVTLGTTHGGIVLELCKEMFKPGSIPHYFSVKTLADFAAANVFIVVPELPDLIGRCLPMMGMVRHDNMKWVFTVAFTRFSEAILNYVANIERATDKSITVSRFSQSMYSAFELMFNSWLSSKEPKLRFAVVEALGVMSHILDAEKLAELLPRLVPAMLNLFKKWTPDLLPVTQGFCTLLDAATRDDHIMLEPQLDLILQTLYPLLQHVPDFSQQKALRNYNELLRCFEKLCRPFSTRVVNFIFQRLEQRDEASRVGGLTALKHIVNSCEAYMADKKELVVTGLKPLLIDTNLQVRQALSQIIIAMGNHDYLRLEGGETLVQFIVRQCAITERAEAPPVDKKRKSAVEELTPLQLRTMCDNILLMATRTISCMELVLWPYLLEFVVPAEYTEAVPTVARCCVILADRLAEADSDSYDIDFDVDVNLPKPQQILARLLVLSGHPLHRDRGQYCLDLLRAMSVIIHENVEDLWDDVVPKLMSYIETNRNDWQQNTWEDLLLKFLSRTLDAVNDEEWIIKLGEALAAQYELYAGMPDFRNMLSKALGVVCRKSTKRDFVDAHLDVVFMSVDHTSQVEREGCAKGFGFAASSHLDLVIEKLGELTKREMIRKSTGFLGMIKDKTEADVARIKATIMLTYGYVTLFAPPTLITSRVEVNILASINPHFTNIKDTTVKENLIRCVKLIGTALHPDHLKTSDFIFARRGDLLEHMKEYIRAEPQTTISTEIRALAIDACMTLLLLEPKLSEADLFQLVDISAVSILEIHEPPEGDERYAELLSKAVESLNELLAVVVDKDTTSACLQSILRHFTKWITSAHAHQRARSMECCVNLLEAFHKSSKKICKVGENRGSVEGLGKFLADFVPRCTDTDMRVRKSALHCIQILLRIQETFHGEDEADRLIEAITQLQERAEKSEPQVLFSVVNDLAKVFSKKISNADLLSFLYPLLEGLLDSIHDSADGCCVVVNGMFRFRGAELEGEVATLVDALHAKLSAVHQERTQTGILRALRTLAGHHLKEFLDKLLSFDLPYNKNVVDTWQTLCADVSLAEKVLDDLIEILTTSQPYQAVPKKNKRDEHNSLQPPMKAICGLTELLKVEETEDLINSRYPQVIVPVLARVCASIDLKHKGKNKPMDDAIAALKAFIELTESTFISEILDENEEEGGWKSLESFSTVTDGLTNIAAVLCEHKKSEMPKIVQLLEGCVRRVYETDRILATCFFAEIINQQCAGDISLLPVMKNHLLSKMVDQSHVVRMLCIRGLGNVAALPDHILQQHTTAVVSAMMNGMDDHNDPEDDITLEAMRGLSKVFSKVDEDNIRSILINISLRIRPCFEKDKPKVRAAAFELFGNLVRFGDGPSKQPFIEQIHSNLVTLFLHLEDGDEKVAEAVKITLIRVIELLGANDLHGILKNEFKPGRQVHFGELMNEVSKQLIVEFDDKISFYVMGCVDFFRSEHAGIKAAAALFAGFLLHALPNDKRKSITKEHVCAELIRLLRDPAVDVKRCAAEAIALLYDY